MVFVMNKKISLFSLIMLIVASVDNIRNLPASALFGSSLIFFFVISAIVFLIPTALVAAELTSIYPNKGGVYRWINEAFGSRWALVAIWMQWINTIVWYPTILSAIAGTAAYLINPELIHHKGYLVVSILTIFWSVTLLNFLGLHFSSLVNTVCGLMGIIIPMLFLIILGGVWVFSGQPLQIELTAKSIVPCFSDTTCWVSLIAIMASFLGMELAGVHVNDIKDPQKNFPKAILLSSLFILVTMVLGSLAIAFVLPMEKISLVSGVMQVLSSLFEEFGLTFLTPVLTILITLGLTGSIINWLISPAKGLLHAAEFGYLPPFFRKKNSRGVPTNILLMQAVLVSLFCFLFLLVPGVNAFYWFLTALSTELYMIMYILMFLAALKLHYKYVNRPLSFKIPGKTYGMWLTALLGCAGCMTTIAVSFFPPDNIDVGSNTRYVLMVAIANFLTILPVFLFYLYKKRKEGTC
jgi:glutamate:GABA antiporter